VASATFKSSEGWSNKLLRREKRVLAPSAERSPFGEARPRVEICPILGYPRTMDAKAAPASERLSGPGLRSFFRVAEAWRLTIAEQQSLLGGVAKQTIHNWRARPQDARLTADQLDRVSYVLGIYKSLHVLFTRPGQADTWIRRDNTAEPFGGHPAADLILGGRMEDLIRVQRYLDGARGVW
jgi:Protein of unknown function (DUF2384)